MVAVIRRIIFKVNKSDWFFVADTLDQADELTG